jgi:hypothetical protein
MTDLILKKYNLLGESSKKEVLDFIDFLLNKDTKPPQKGLSDYKKKILTVSTWSDSDIDLIVQNQQKLNQWKAPEW